MSAPTNLPLAIQIGNVWRAVFNWWVLVCGKDSAGNPQPLSVTTDGTLNVKNVAGTAVIGHVINDAGSAIMGKVGIDQTTPGTTNKVYIGADGILAGEYETVAASATAQVLGATGGTGDFISGLLVIPATTSPGNVLLLDNATSITIFTGGATSVSNLVPFFIPLGMVSVSGAWKVTTGANVSVIGIGNFT